MNDYRLGVSRCSPDLCVHGSFSVVHIIMPLKNLYSGIVDTLS